MPQTQTRPRRVFAIHDIDDEAMAGLLLAQPRCQPNAGDAVVIDLCGAGATEHGVDTGAGQVQGRAQTGKC